MKILVNVSKNFGLLIIKAKYIFEFEAFTGYDSKLKHELVEVVNTYDKMFQEYVISAFFLPFLISDILLLASFLQK